MSSIDKVKHVREHLLESAINDLESVGRYWNGSISRTMRGTLVGELEKEGISVSYIEIAPDWEHVFFLKDEFNSIYSALLDQIAIKRSIQRESDTKESMLEK